jgi:N-acetyl-alpha-D-muramate 1-phosphate uridylyltransferase
MILAAGKGERMRPLTDDRPKPMLPVAGKPLIEYHLERLSAVGLREFVVNLGWHGGQIRDHLGDGARWGVKIAYSEEGWPALESGGGIFHALPLLGRDPFIVVNGDVYADYPWRQLVDRARTLPQADLGHLVLVPNPAHNPKGDFVLEDGRVSNAEQPRLTFSGLSVHRPEFFEGCTAGHFPLLPLWRRAADRDHLSGELFEGRWSDVGTPQRLADLECVLGVRKPA